MRKQPFNCCHVRQGLTRTRAEAYEGEPRQGTFVVWQVLGFGGRPNPLMFARVASSAMRSSQCLANILLEGVGKYRSQLYVDDPALCVAGPKAAVVSTLDAVLLWWLILGLPLAWSKGSFFPESEQHI